MTPLLDRVQASTAVLRELSPAELDALAVEIRGRLVETVARNGGHLGANLGVVELTLALAAELTLPRDRLVWDVGHQCYPWKLVTGRADRFDTIRRLGGLAGFPKRAESPCDSFDTGHSSTSISAALGLAKARDMRGEDHNVVAVIGDGALGGGLALEGLNHAGRVGRRFTVVLNDNAMSIGANVGAVSRYLNRIRTEPFYRDSRDYARDLLRGIPRVGDLLYRIAARTEASLKYLVVPGVFFEELGFTYLGPVDGHDVGLLRETLRHAFTQGSKPVLVHVTTVKGKGYEPAEREVSRFHGTGPFDAATGEPVASSGPPSYTEVFGRTMVEIGERDERVVAITAAMAHGTGLVPFSERFPARYIDVGIAEGHAVTLAAGMAAAGLRPVVAIYSTFLQRAYDQIIHDVCLQGLPVVFAVDRGGLVGEDGPTHHGVFDLAFLRGVPGLTVMAPRDEAQLRLMLATALAQPGPVAVRYPRGAGTGAATDGPLVPLGVGTAEVLREGGDLAFLALGTMVGPALEAAEGLALAGVQATVVDARFAKPLDEGLILDLARRGLPLVTAEEGVLAGGFGSAVLELLEREGVAARVGRVGLGDSFIPHGSVRELRVVNGLTGEGCRACAERLLGRGVSGKEVGAS